MKKVNIVREKSFQFAIRAIRLFQYITKSKQEYVLSKQLLCSGTSIGANIREADNAVSKADFINKMGIAQKECDEVIYWLELLKATDYLTDTEFISVYNDANSLLKLIRTIILNTKRNLAS
ncbi:four helix bundle protein [Larkinella humicola]|uniref:Four helix bundle protein n=1 Tax=Larkinella humicola TaxID=2607654 RepID=A0A5N1J9D9_9BACT|nr:four helix bundle protein [Larkinella humicola]KAA9349267.1 four helix bundle protein [Larkinella humicola]